MLSANKSMAMSTWRVSLQSTEAVPNTPPSARESRLSKLNRLGNSEETPDKTDGESSYSSFYSSFFKTESGSAEDSGDGKNGKDKQARVNIALHQLLSRSSLIYMSSFRRSNDHWYYLSLPRPITASSVAPCFPSVLPFPRHLDRIFQAIP